MIKKSLTFMFLVFVSCIVFSSFALAENEKLQIDLQKESISAGEDLGVKVSLLDENNKPINSYVNVILEDAQKNQIMQEVETNRLVYIDLGGNPLYGYWKITSKFQELEATSVFDIEMQELVEFRIEGDLLYVKNIGNSRYTKSIQILIGDTVGTKRMDLAINEEISLRLVAPDGVYNVKVTDGKTTVTKNNVALTGNVIGVFDERIKDKSPITGGADLYNDSRKVIVYIFLIVVLIATIIINIETRFRKREKLDAFRYHK